MTADEEAFKIAVIRGHHLRRERWGPKRLEAFATRLGITVPLLLAYINERPEADIERLSGPAHALLSLLEQLNPAPHTRPDPVPIIPFNLT